MLVPLRRPLGGSIETSSILLNRVLLVTAGGVEKRRSDVSLPVANGQIFTWPPQSGLA